MKSTRLPQILVGPFLIWAASILAASAASDKPNVVFMMADDLGYGELGCYGQKKIHTPNIDKLATQGIRLTSNYSGAPVCAPARCVLMTGKHLGHAYIRGNRQANKPGGPEGQWPIPAEEFTIAEAFQQAGYVTGAFGKWGLGPDDSTGDPMTQGFDHFHGYICQAVAHSYFPPHLWKDGEKQIINQHPVPGHKQQPEGEVKMEDYFAENYSSDILEASALAFLDTYKDKPFFLYLPFIEPHVAMHPPKEQVEAYPESWDDRPYRGQCGYLPHPRPRAGYAAMISHLDAHVGAILKKLDALGLSDNTLVVFTSDNGTTHPSGGDKVFGIGGVDAAFFNSTDGLRGFKGSVYEGGIRVPMIVRWPGKIKPGTTSDVVTYFPDQFPTLCAAAGLPTPSGLDGINILPALLGQEAPADRNPLVWVYPEYGGQLCVRFGDWKLVHQNLSRKNAPIKWELYNLKEDRNETRDLAAEHPDLVAQGVAILKAQTSANEVFPLAVPDVK